MAAASRRRTGLAGVLTSVVEPDPTPATEQPTTPAAPPPTPAPAADVVSAATEPTTTGTAQPQAAQAPAPAPPAAQDTAPATEPARAPRRRTAQAVEPQGPRYLSLVKKDTRLPQEHLDQLTILIRQIKRRRQPGASPERLTDNTLIRIAVAHLLAHADSLQGDTEAELLASLERH